MDGFNTFMSSSLQRYWQILLFCYEVQYLFLDYRIRLRVEKFLIGTGLRRLLKNGLHRIKKNLRSSLSYKQLKNGLHRIKKTWETALSYSWWLKVLENGLHGIKKYLRMGSIGSRNTREQCRPTVEAYFRIGSKSTSENASPPDGSGSPAPPRPSVGGVLVSPGVEVAVRVAPVGIPHVAAGDDINYHRQ